MNLKPYLFFRRPESLNCRRDIRPLRPTPTQSGMPLRGVNNLRFAPDLRPLHPPALCGFPSGWSDLGAYALAQCGPHTRPSALRDPFQADGIGCLRTRAMRPTHPPLRFAGSLPG